MTMKTLIMLFVCFFVISGCSSSATSESPNSIVPKSTFKNTTVWNSGQKFWNVIGSTDDPKIDHSSWIAIYRDKCGTYPGKLSATGTMCPHNALGGHVVKDGQSQYPAKNSAVYILPICTSENNQPSLEMTVAADDTCVVVLNYWMK